MCHPHYKEETTDVRNNSELATISATEALELSLDRLPALDGTEVSERTLARIFNAETLDAAAGDPDSKGLKELSGQVITVNSVDGWLPSDRKDGNSRYIVLSITDPVSKAESSATTGSTFAMAVALKAHFAGWLPADFRVVELESKSNPGQSSLWLVKA